MEIPKSALAPWALAAAATLVFLGFLHARPFPDEGIFLTGGWLVSQGLLPYQNFFDIHNPGLFLFLGQAYGFFGASLEGSRLLVLLLNAATLLTVFALARRIFNEKTALVASALHAVWLPIFYGFWMVIEPFTAFLSTAAALLLHRVVVEKKRAPADFLLLGAALGLTLVFKQTMLIFVAAMLALLAGYFLAYRRTRGLFSLKTAALVSGFAVVPALTLAPYALNNSLGALLYQTWGYNLANAGLLSNTGFKMEYLVIPALLFFFVPLSLYWATKRGFNLLDRATWERILLFTWFFSMLPNVFPLVGCCHHLEPMAPAAAILSAGVLAKIMENKYKKLLALSALAMLATVSLSGFLVVKLAGQDEFGPAREIADFVQKNTDPKDPIFVFHDNPEIYFLAQRRPASKYLYYPYLTPEGFAAMQRELKDELMLRQPKLVVDFSGHGEPLNPDGKAEAEQWVLEHYAKTKEFRFDPAYGDYYRYAYVYERR